MGGNTTMVELILWWSSAEQIKNLGIGSHYVFTELAKSGNLQTELATIIFLLPCKLQMMYRIRDTLRHMLADIDNRLQIISDSIIIGIQRNGSD